MSDQQPWSEFEAFKMGWKAARMVDDVPECFFNPNSGKTPQQMFVQLKNTCAKGHYTFRIPPERHRESPCSDCDVLLKRGKYV